MAIIYRPLCLVPVDKMSNIIMPMTTESDEFLFTNELCARVKALREGKGWTAEQMATALGIPPERYRKYENRSPIPQYLIPRFALIVDRSVEFVLTGAEPKLINARPVARSVARPLKIAQKKLA